MVSYFFFYYLLFLFNGDLQSKNFTIWFKALCFDLADANKLIESLA